MARRATLVRYGLVVGVLLTFGRGGLGLGRVSAQGEEPRGEVAEVGAPSAGGAAEAPTATPTATGAPAPSLTPSVTATATGTPVPALTPTVTPTGTATPRAPTATATPTPTATPLRGTRLYVSNRNSNDVAVFTLDSSGNITGSATTPPLGDWTLGAWRCTRAAAACT
jgi:hypothetical protein